jgi:hypothetical protein
MFNIAIVLFLIFRRWTRARQSTRGVGGAHPLAAASA